MKENIGGIFNSILAALGVACGFLFGELNGLLIAVLVLMAIDYVTGVASSFVLKTTSSKIGLRGIIKKCVMLLIIVVAHILDVYALGISDGGAALLPLVEFLFIANEGLSIIENAGKLGIKLPTALTEALVQLKIMSNSKTVIKKDDTAQGDKSSNTTESTKDAQSE